MAASKTGITSSLRAASQDELKPEQEPSTISTLLQYLIHPSSNVNYFYPASVTDHDSIMAFRTFRDANVVMVTAPVGALALRKKFPWRM